MDEKASKASFLSVFKDKHKLESKGSTHSSTMSEAVKSDLEDRNSDAELDTMSEAMEVEQISDEEREPSGDAGIEEPLQIDGMLNLCIIVWPTALFLFNYIYYPWSFTIQWHA